MAIGNAKTLNVRIRNKYDSYENWAASSLVLEAGEIAIAYTSVDVNVDNGTAKHPALLMKVGNGTDTFANLPWMSAKAADVLAVCKNEDDLKAFVNGIIADAGIASDEAMQELAGKVTTAEGKITTLEGKMTTAEGKITTAEGAIDALELLVGDKSVNTQIQEYVAGLNLADTYAAKVHKHEIADVNGLSDSIAAAKKAGTDASEALEAYKTLNDAAVKVNSDAIAGIKNGETMNSFKAIEEALAGKQASGDFAVNGHKHEIADVNGLSDAIADAKKAGTDAAAAAGQALVDAKAYTDAEVAEWIGDKTVGTQISEAIANYTNTTDMNSAIAAAKKEATDHADGLNTAMNTRVEALEAIDHTHSFVESELNEIKAGDVAKWNAAEQNAKDYADGLDKAMDSRVDALEAKFGDGEGNVEAQIAAAVAAEAEIARAAEQANAKAITDLTNGAVKDNADAIAALEGLVSDTPVAEQISGAIEEALKVEVEGSKVDKYALATDLAAEAEAARAAEKANADAIKVLNGNAETEGSVDYKVAQAVAAIMENPDDTMNSINELVTWVNDHASDALEMSNQVSANKTAIETLNGDVTKEGSVDKKIADAIANENLSQYATAENLGKLDTRVTTVENDLNTETTGLKARMTQAEADIDALETKVGDKTVSEQIETAIADAKADASNKDAVVLAEITAAVEQHNTDKAALEADIAKKANDADLAAIAKTGSTDDLVQGELVLVFDCGGAGV